MNEAAASAVLPQPPYPWFNSVWERFTSTLQAKQLSHALLLVGASGTGALALAETMGQLRLCAAPQQGQSCGSCKACQLLKAGGHPDFHRIGLEEKAQNIKIDQIREVAGKIAQTAQQGGAKVVVIYPAESMNSNAANALLKNLEEPSGDTFFILVSENPASIMATIRSRCNLWALPQPSLEQSQAWLERNKITDADQLLRQVGNNPLTVIEWLESDLFTQRNDLEEKLSQLINQQGDSIKLAQKLVAMGAPWVVDQLLSWVHSASIKKVMAEQTNGVGLEFILSQYQARALQNFYGKLAQRKRMLASGANPNPELLINETLAELQNLAIQS